MNIKQHHQKMEENAGKILQGLGYSIKRRRFFEGPDILATHRGSKVAVEVKVSRPTIVDVAKVHKFNADYALIYTESTPMPSAVALAEQQKVRIVGLNELKEYADQWIGEKEIQELGKAAKARAPALIPFTLIELMIVLIIIAILIVVAVPSYMYFVHRAYESEAKATLGAIRSSLMVVYYEHNESFPDFVWGSSDETSKANDILYTLKVDTTNNRWWQAGFEGESPADPVTARFGTVKGTTKPIALDEITLINPAGPLIWAYGKVGPIEDFQILYDVGADRWYISPQE